MQRVADLVVALVAALHFYFLVLEMFLWTKPMGLKIFKQSLEQAQSSRVLAANQGLYNGFLSAGLIWGLFRTDPFVAAEIKILVLICVVVAGVFGAVTVNKRIFFVQSLPAIIALILMSL